VGTQALRQPLSSDGPTKKTIVSLLGHPPAKHRKKNDLIVRGSSRAMLYEMITIETFGSTIVDTQSS